MRTGLIPAQGLVECLLVFLKGQVLQYFSINTLGLTSDAEPVALDISDQVFIDCAVLVDRIQKLISMAQLSLKEFESDALVCTSFAVMLECSLHSTEFWECFSNHQRTGTLLQYLTLDSRSTAVRNAAVAAIRTVCGVLPASVYLRHVISRCAVLTTRNRPSKVTRESFILFFWNFFQSAIDKTLHLSQCAEQFYEIALEIFRLRGNHGYDALPVPEYIVSWSNMLSDRGHEEVQLVLTSLTNKS